MSACIGPFPIPYNKYDTPPVVELLPNAVEVMLAPFEVESTFGFRKQMFSAMKFDPQCPALERSLLPGHFGTRMNVMMRLFDCQFRRVRSVSESTI